jgi:hypothetical protein
MQLKNRCQWVGQNPLMIDTLFFVVLFPDFSSNLSSLYFPVFL